MAAAAAESPSASDSAPAESGSGFSAPHMSNSTEPEAVRDRRNRLRELTGFTEACEEQIKELLETLGWSPERSQEVKEMEVCPYDPGHRVPAPSLEAHATSCSLRKKGYSNEELVQLCSSSEPGVRSFMMDKETQHHVIQRARSAAPLMRMEGVFWQGQYSGRPVDVPHNHKRAVCDLTVADRLALYDHVVQVVRGQAEGAASSGNDDLYVDLVSKLQKDDEQKEPKTHLELMAEMRDYKRRRQSYRAKNVHITKKSYTEVIREVISVHSEELARQWREELEDEEGAALSEGSAHRRRSASSESRLSHGRRHHSRDRESKKKKKRRRDSRSPEQHKKKKKKKHKEERQGRRSDSA